jgi:hypothetical protein
VGGRKFGLASRVRGAGRPARPPERHPMHARWRTPGSARAARGSARGSRAATTAWAPGASTGPRPWTCRNHTKHISAHSQNGATTCGPLLRVRAKRHPVLHSAQRVSGLVFDGIRTIPAQPPHTSTLSNPAATGRTRPDRRESRSGRGSERIRSEVPAALHWLAAAAPHARALRHSRWALCWHAGLAGEVATPARADDHRLTTAARRWASG